MPEGIPLLLGDNGAQGVSFIYPGAHAPCLSPYHYAVVMAFDEVLLVPRAEAVHHVFVSQFQHPEVFGSLHPVVYIQFKEFAFHIQHRHGICLTGTFQYPEFFIQVFFLLRIDIKLLIHHARTHGLGELFVGGRHFTHDEVKGIVLQVLDVVGAVVPFYFGQYAAKCLYVFQ